MPKISFISSDDRKYNVSRSLSLIKSEITSRIKIANNVLLKVNCEFNDYQLSATHTDAIEAVLEFISPYLKKQPVLISGSRNGPTLDAFKKYGYFNIQDKYDFAVVDLNSDNYQEVRTNPNDKQRVEISKTILESDYIISICPPKTHSELQFSGVIENVCLGSLAPSQGLLSTLFSRKLFPSKQPNLLKNGDTELTAKISALYKTIPISLSVLDGYTSMQGDGPGSAGELAATHWALTSVSAIGADMLGCKLLDINPDDIPYLSAIKQSQGRDFVEEVVVGDDWRQNIMHIKPHHNFS